MRSNAVVVALVAIATVLTSPAAAARILHNTPYDNVLQQDVCGVPPIKPDIGESTGNIVGGKEAIPHSWPWQIELLLYGAFHCGGSVLEKRWIVTAAHCLVDGENKPLSPDAIQVIVGQHDRTEAEPTKITVKAKSIHVNEKYYETPDGVPVYDIGLIELQTEIPFNKYIQPVCLPTTDFKEGTMCATTGWGAQEPHLWKRRLGSVSFRENDSTKLMEVAVPIFSQTKCVANYNNEVKDCMICAGYPQGGKDACQGDSGGPLVCHGADGVWQLVGLTSWGAGCAEPNLPGVYTRVQMFNEWIKNIVHQ